MKVLTVDDLKTYFYVEGDTIKAVDGVSFSVSQGEIVGLVGESGSGKSVTALSIMRLIFPPGRIISGTIKFLAQDLTIMKSRKLRRIRGYNIGMVYQNPHIALNPMIKVGDQIAEVFLIHEGLSKQEAKRKAIELMELVEIPAPEHRYNSYPRELSGGMKQRIIIAMAIALEPELLIADEPTTALDVTTQAGILKLLRSLARKLDMAMILITHDLEIIRQMTDRVCVMYCGKIVEKTDTDSLFANPKNPYTKKLLDCIPKVTDQGRQKLSTIEGYVPSPAAFPPGCRFAPRCEEVMEICKSKLPDLAPAADNHLSRCWLHSTRGDDNGFS